MNDILVLKRIEYSLIIIIDVQMNIYWTKGYSHSGINALFFYIVATSIMLSYV